MKERTSTSSITALIAGIMSVITIFGGYTAILGVFFALFGIIVGSRGKREQPTKTAIWSVRISIIGMILCSVVALLLIMLYAASAMGLSDFSGLSEKMSNPFDLGAYYQKAKEYLIRFINHF